MLLLGEITSKSCTLRWCGCLISVAVQPWPD